MADLLTATLFATPIYTSNVTVGPSSQHTQRRALPLLLAGFISPVVSCLRDLWRYQTLKPWKPPSEPETSPSELPLCSHAADACWKQIGRYGFTSFSRWKRKSHFFCCISHKSVSVIHSILNKTFEWLPVNKMYLFLICRHIEGYFTNQNKFNHTDLWPASYV